MKYNKLTRRMFLQGTSKLLAIPFLESLLPSIAFAQTASNNPIYIQMGFSAGLERVFSYPLVSPSAVPYQNIEQYTKMRKLQDLINREGQISALLDPSWNQYAGITNLFTNTHLYGHPDLLHNTMSAFAARGPVDQYDSNPAYSVDHRVQEAWKRQGYNAPFDAIRANVAPYKTYKSFSYGDSRNGIPGYNYKISESVASLENIIFSAAQPSAPTNSTVTDKKRVVDHVLEDYNNLINGKKISSLDKSRLSDAMDMWNDIAKRSESTGGGGCSVPDQQNINANVDAKQKHACDLMVAALQCGLTRVVCHDISTLHPDHAYTGSNDNVFYHDSSHYQAGGTPSSTDPNLWKNWSELLKLTGSRWHQADGFKWRYSIVKRYLDRLSSITDSNGQSLMDRALIMTSSEYSEGDHSFSGRIVHTFGNAGGKLQTGMQINCGTAPIQKPFTTVMRALGLSQSDIEVEGYAGFGHYDYDSADFHGTEIGARRFLSNVDLIHETGRRDDLRQASNALKTFYGSTTERRKIIPIVNT